MLHINPFDKTHCFVVYRDKKSLVIALKVKVHFLATKNHNCYTKIEIKLVAVSIKLKNAIQNKLQQEDMKKS